MATPELVFGQIQVDVPSVGVDATAWLDMLIRPHLSAARVRQLVASTAIRGCVRHAEGRLVVKDALLRAMNRSPQAMNSCVTY